MDVIELKRLILQLPRKPLGFYPTPFHRLDNLSRAYGVNFFMKREDLSGPGTLSGSKMRLAEFIVGQAIEDGVDTLITLGVYLTNSGMQFAAAARAAGINPILFLTRDAASLGPLRGYRGNLLLSRLMDVEMHMLDTSGAAYWKSDADTERVTKAIKARKEQLEAKGHKVVIVPSGGAHPSGFVAHALTFCEMIEQASAAGASLDYIYHTAGTGTALPGLIAAKLLTHESVKVRSVSINSYSDRWMNYGLIVDRVKHIFRVLNMEAPRDEIILEEIDVDERFIGDDYAVPSTESIAAIRELAKADAVFLGPVYTGKGFAGLLDHVRSGRVELGGNVAFLHTGDTANLFEIPEVVGNIV